MKLPEILRSLGLDDVEISTYLSLLKHGAMPAGKLARKVGVVRSSLYGILGRLIEHGLVGESLEQGIKAFIAETPEKVILLFNRRIEELTHSRDEFQTLVPELERGVHSGLLRPRLEMFEGGEGLRSVLKDMLLYYNLETFALWPIKNMIKVLKPEFFRYLNKERIRNRLWTRAIWPASQVIDFRTHPYLGVGQQFQREIRIAPPKVEFPMGYWSYGRKTAFISSHKETFGFLIESEDLTLTMRAQFDVLWNLSLPLKVDERDTRAFLEELKRYG